ncbi:hypothetical protein JTB14_011351 [Gonioctena quinquepunctata]|nr:hypothetical protein JTB14_011351 [Gonioctena quinquepunctata]
MLGHMARAKRADRKEQELYKELPITLPVNDKEMVDILISLPPVHNSCLRVLSMEELAVIEKNTRQQNITDLCSEMRIFRCTASKFGFVSKRKVFNVAFLILIQPETSVM